MPDLESQDQSVGLTASHRRPPSYTPSQIQKYLTRINLPQKYRTSPVFSNPSLAKTHEHGLPLVVALHRHHISSIPFENLEIHYSTHRTTSVDTEVLFTKFVENGLTTGRGGHCMEHNTLFGAVLRGLGYEVRNCAARVSKMVSRDRETREKEGDRYGGWTHMLNLVLFDDQWWVVDVGAGEMGPYCVYPLQDGFEGVEIPPRKIRLQLRVIPEHASESAADAPKLWCMDFCHQPRYPSTSPTDDSKASGDSWTPRYCFTEVEFLPQDFEIMSWFVSTNKRSYFTEYVFCEKVLLDESQDHIIGNVALFNDRLRQTVSGQQETLMELKTEADRVRALQEVFGVTLPEEERAAFRGTRHD